MRGFPKLQFLLAFAVLLGELSALSGMTSSPPGQSPPYLRDSYPGAPDGAASDLAQQLNDDLTDGACDTFSLLEAALIAGGIRNLDQLETLVAKFDSVCNQEAASIEAAEGFVESLDALLDCLHHRFLTGDYRADCSELDRTLTVGHFNCVTSTILFRALCERFHVSTHAIAARRHLFCGQLATAERIIETTSRTWRLRDSDDTGPILRSAAEEGKLREISDVQLIAKVYYNHGVAHLESRQFARAVDSLRLAWQLDRDDPAARENLAAAYNNWALSESDAGRSARAVDLIVAGLSVDPRHAALLANDLYIHQKWVQSLCREGEFQTAVEVLDRAYRRRPQVLLFDRGRVAVNEKWEVYQFNRGPSGLPSRGL